MLKSGFWKLGALCLLIVAAASATPLIATQGGSIAGRSLGRAAVTHGDHKGSLAGAQRLRLLSAYAKLPMTFESNRGQTAKQVKFVSRGPGYSLFLTPTEAVIALKQDSSESKPSAKSRPVRAHGRKPVETGCSVLRISLDDAAKSPAVTGLDPLPGKANYFIGNDPRKWHTNLPTYSRVKYRNVYKGIDLIYHRSSQRELEYDFIVAPGADPKLIQLSFKGAKRLAVNNRGDLTVSIAGGEVIERAPIVYQEVDGSRRVLSGRYVKRGARGIGFEIADYDPRMPLVIDPVLVYSTYLGGSGYDQGFSIAVDSSDDAYLVGYTSSTNFPTTAGAFQTAYGGGADDAFVTKLNATGTALIYSTYFGGSGQDLGIAIAVDSLGNAYVTGYTKSSDFPTTPGAFQTTLRGATNAFITKLNASATALIYSTYLGGSNMDSANGIAIDSSGNAYVVGYDQSTDFPTTPGAFQTAFGGGFADASVTKLNASGTALIYSTYLGGNADDAGGAIALDSSGNASVVGYTASNNFPTTPGAFQTSLPNPADKALSSRNSIQLVQL